MSGRRVPVNITVDRKKPANNYALNRLTHKLQALKTKFICTLLIELKVWLWRFEGSTYIYISVIIVKAQQI